ncbi:hypothetical protein LSH36_543g01024, partial [Paralvinella palmiformis]
KRRRQQSLFKKMGIPGPEPNWLFGNLHQLINPAVYITLQKWTKQYNKLYGYYEGCTPVLVINDLDMIQDVFVKKHSSFRDRKVLFFDVPEDSDFNHMFVARGARWKRLRTIVSPTFSAVKLKLLLPLIEEKVNTLLEKLSETAEGECINIMKLYQGLTLDIIADTAFGIKVDSLNNSDEPFLINCRKLFDSLAPSKRSIVLTLAKVFPELDKVLWRLFQIVMKIKKMPQVELLRTMGNAVEDHITLLTKQNSFKFYRTDLLQLMLDAKADDYVADEVLTMTADAETEGISIEEMASSETSDENKSCNAASVRGHGIGRKKLTTQEIKSQSFLFLVAGYETTSTALSYCTYLLSTNPDVQDKLLEEIDHFLPQGTKATYDILQQMSYLRMVLYETLRLYPLASNGTNRKCSEACTVGGIHIPKDICIQPDVWSVHYDPDIWGDNPEQFNPERFSKEAIANRHPMAWMPFGLGPRNCIGLRFALVEAKMALAEILRKYSFKPCCETNKKLLLQESGVVIVPKNGVQVILVPRQHK